MRQQSTLSDFLLTLRTICSNLLVGGSQVFTWWRMSQPSFILTTTHSGNNCAIFHCSPLSSLQPKICLPCHSVNCALIPLLSAHQAHRKDFLDPFASSERHSHGSQPCPSPFSEPCSERIVFLSHQKHHPFLLRGESHRPAPFY